MAKPKKAKPQAKPEKAKARTKPQKDEEREERIMMEVVVDAHDEDERAMGWYYYLEETLNAPSAQVRRGTGGLAAGSGRRGRGGRDRAGTRVRTRDVRLDPLEQAEARGALGPAGGHRGG